MIEHEDFGVTEVAGELYNACYPGQVRSDPVAPTPDSLMYLCGAIATMFDDWWVIIQENWDQVLNADETPDYALKYTAQFGGVKAQPSWTTAQLRAEVTSPSGFGRGTPAAMIQAIQRTLTGDKAVLMIERNNGEAYQLFIRTLTSETPNEAFTLQAILTQKPAGIALDYDAFSGQTFATLDASYASFNAADTDYSSFDEMLGDIDL